MNSEQFKELYDKYFYYLIAGGLVFGAVIGLIPLLFGIRRGNRNLGIVAFIVTLIDSGISPLLGLVTCVIFTVIIMVKRPQRETSENDVDNQNVAGVSINNSQDN